MGLSGRYNVERKPVRLLDIIFEIFLKVFGIGVVFYFESWLCDPCHKGVTGVTHVNQLVLSLQPHKNNTCSNQIGIV